MADNIRSTPGVETIVDIDHSRLAAKAGSSMPPAHVLIWSDPALEAVLLQRNQLVGVDLPLRALAFEQLGSGSAKVISNSYDYLAQGHGLPADPSLQRGYEAAIAVAFEGLPARAVRQGVTLRPTVLILFGGPGPGGKAMASAPTLGLDAFCPKVLIWQDADGAV